MRVVTILILLSLCLPLTAFGGSQPAKEKTALRAAQQFLALVDQGHYGQSWDQAAGLFQRQVSRESWQKLISGVRQPLGPLVSRRVTSSQYLKSVPGAPDGEYVLILFATSFEHKQAAFETVTTMLDRDGHWRVAGYFIR